MSKERLTAEEYICEWCDKTYHGGKELCDWTTDEVMKFANDFARQEVEAAIAETKKQKDELLEALKELVHLHGCEQEGIGSGQPTPEQWYKAVDKASLAITNAQEK
jgi:hypothetical protein